jgi:hypothetical protein
MVKVLFLTRKELFGTRGLSIKVKRVVMVECFLMTGQVFKVNGPQKMKHQVR